VFWEAGSHSQGLSISNQGNLEYNGGGWKGWYGTLA